MEPLLHDAQCSHQIIVQRVQSSTDMEVDSTTVWSSVDTICEESEMIAHLQSVFWGSSDLDVDPNLSSNSSSPVDYQSFCTGPLLNITQNAAFDRQYDNLGSGNGAMVGSKRKIQPDHELMISGEEEDCAVPVATRTHKKSEKDSQSQYAKKRRQRINERLRILQELIPNGTKVDISTMLEEAVEYVKFLHLQIKLLSSDELWMYAPLAYRGINIGVHLDTSSAQE